MNRYIVVAGNIGAGKSTLVEKLSGHFNWKPYYEPVGENPYLEDFYSDMKLWAYKSQLYFLSDRLEMHRRLQNYNGSVVQDRSVYEDSEIFARNLYKTGYMDERDYATYRKMYNLIVEMLVKPDVIVYLKASVDTLQRRIALRGRDFESSIADGYLEQLNELYEDWIGSWDRCPVLTLNMNELDFASSSADFSSTAEKISSMLRGSQSELF